MKLVIANLRIPDEHELNQTENNNNLTKSSGSRAFIGIPTLTLSNVSRLETEILA